jgi:c-di-GMP-binding flagellar brake protein YcgR
MEPKGIERRTCKRFDVSGATVSYTQNELSTSEKRYEEELCQILDMSRGGIKFLGKKSPEIDSELNLKIFIPGERLPLTFRGKVRWISVSEKKEKYLVGIQFNPYGEKQGQNYPGNLVKIIALEQKYLAYDESPAEKLEIDD